MKFQILMITYVLFFFTSCAHQEHPTEGKYKIDSCQYRYVNEGNKNRFNTAPYDYDGERLHQFIMLVNPCADDRKTSDFQKYSQYIFEKILSEPPSGSNNIEKSWEGIKKLLNLPDTIDLDQMTSSNPNVSDFINRLELIFGFPKTETPVLVQVEKDFVQYIKLFEYKIFDHFKDFVQVLIGEKEFIDTVEPEKTIIINCVEAYECIRKTKYLIKDENGNTIRTFRHLLAYHYKYKSPKYPNDSLPSLDQYIFDSETSYIPNSSSDSKPKPGPTVNSIRKSDHKADHNVINDDEGSSADPFFDPENELTGNDFYIYEEFSYYGKGVDTIRLEISHKALLTTYFPYSIDEEGNTGEKNE